MKYPIFCMGDDDDDGGGAMFRVHKRLRLAWWMPLTSWQAAKVGRRVFRSCRCLSSSAFLLWRYIHTEEYPKLKTEENPKQYSTKTKLSYKGGRKKLSHTPKNSQPLEEGPIFTFGIASPNLSKLPKTETKHTTAQPLQPLASQTPRAMAPPH